MKRVCFVCFFVLVSCLISFSQVTIGTGTVSQNYPFRRYDCSRSVSLYTAAEIGTTGKITSLAWNVEITGYEQSIKIYLKVVDGTTLTTGSWTNSVNSATLVYNGNYEFASTGWQVVDITDFDFCADGKSLLVLCETNSWADEKGKFYATNVSNMHKTSDSGSSENTANTQTMTMRSSRPNIQINFTPCVTCSGATLASPVVTSTPDNGSVTLTWENVPNALSYSLVWNNGAPQTVTSPFTITGLNNSTTYSYSLTAIGNGTTFCDSDPFDATAKPGTAVPPCLTNDPASDICSVATSICNFNGYCGSTRGSEYTAGTEIPDGGLYNKCIAGGGWENGWGNIITHTCNGSFNVAIDNDSWLSFVAAGTELDLNVFVSNCTGTNSAGANIEGNGLQIQVFHTDDCEKFTWGYLSDVTPGSLFEGCYSPMIMEDAVLHITNLVVGEKYYVCIDGHNGDQCDYVISAENGGIMVPEASGDAQICGGQSTQLNASGGVSYVWSASPADASLDGHETEQNPTVSPMVTTVYTVTITGSCDDNATAQVTVTVGGIAPTAENNGPLCTGESLNLNVNSPGATAYSWSGPNGFTSNLQNPTISNVTSVNAGTYTVTVTNSGCSGTATTDVVISDNLAINVTPASPSICAGGSVELTASGANSYSWSGGSLSNSNIANPIASPLATTVYTVTGTQGACSGSTTVTLTVNSVPVVSVSSSNSSICFGQSATLTASGANSYSWSGNSLSSLNSAAPVANPAATTVYTVTGTQGACTGSATITLVVNPLPNISISSPASSICPGASVVLTANNGVNYLWNNNSTSNSITVTPSATTTYSVTGTDANNCSASSNITITMGNNLPVSISASPAQICSGSSTVLTASGADSYQWSTGGSSNSFSVSPTSSSVYSVTGTSGGCTGTASIVVEVSQNVSLTTAASPAIICNGASTNLSASGAVSYQWSNSSTLDNSNIATPTATPATTTTYVVTGTQGACSATAQVVVTVLSLPTVSASASPTSVCLGESSVLMASGATSYTWNDAATIQNVNSSNTIATPTATTTYIVTGTKNSCSNTASVTITVNNAPEISLSADPATICLGNSTTITPSGAVSYFWSHGSTENPLTVQPIANTTYSVVGTDANGCTGNADITINVATEIDVNITPDVDEICIGESSSLLANSPATDVHYVWNIGQETNTITVNPSSTMTYSVVGTDVLGCTGSATAVVNVNPLPTVSFTANPLIGCLPLAVDFHNDCGGNIASYAWTFGDGSQSSSANPSHTYTNSGYYDVSLSVVDDKGCSNDKEVLGFIYAAADPVASFFVDNDFVSDDNAEVQFIDNSSDAVTWLWNFNDLLSDEPISVLPSPSHLFSGSGTFDVSLLVTNNAGCVDSTRSSVIVRSTYNMYLPNSFSPNSDGINDVYTPFGLGWNNDIYSMMIYDRWGKIVFVTSDVNHGWDGTYPDGKKAPQGVYTARIFLRDANGRERVYIQEIVLLGLFE